MYLTFRVKYTVLKTKTDYLYRTFWTPFIGHYQKVYECKKNETDVRTTRFEEISFIYLLILVVKGKKIS